ncbi:hypothetical protein SDC9_78473 [bioreactor metagenome]|uniref:DUF4367 domain-containing protein n=1 Tax=bioreactor metagenome TaxID=1076179 RepID=A0A644YTS7_9ZZZZ|nr:DUF4367 domain-containing protein [Candidatus Metalachnospira sp.]
MKDFNELFETASNSSFVDQINSLNPNEDATYVKLSNNQIESLINKLSSLPEKYIHILFLYYNKANISNLELLNIKNAANYAFYLNQILSASIGLENSLIAHASMIIACDRVLANNTSNLLSSIDFESIEYSSEFKRKLNKLIPNCFATKSHVWLKKIAAILIIMLIGTTSIFTFNATARQKLFNWLINTFPKYSEFFVTSQDTATSDDLNKYHAFYLPGGFNLSEKSELDTIVTEEYQNNSDKFIWILKKITNDTPINLNTEDTEIQWFINDGIEYMYWEKDGVSYITWEKDGITFNINTNVDKSTCIKIAESVKKQ